MKSKSKAEVTNEIRRIVTDRLNAGEIIRAEWLTMEILSTHNAIEGEDADFYVACAVDFIQDTAKRCIGDFSPKAQVKTSAQITMPGFDYMQRAYTVERNGEICVVPVHLLTDDEIEDRALELELMARGCIAHAKELRAFGRGRRFAA